MAHICGPCTLCCKLAEVPSLGKPGGTWCQHVCPDGCAIYKKRPKECKRYTCLWLDSPKMGDDLRPDLCGVMFEPHWNEGVVIAIVDRPGAHNESPAIDMIWRLTGDGYPVVAVEGENVHMCMPPGMARQELFARLAKIEERRP